MATHSMHHDGHVNHCTPGGRLQDVLVWEALITLPWQPQCSYRYVLVQGNNEEGEPIEDKREMCDHHLVLPEGLKHDDIVEVGTSTCSHTHLHVPLDARLHPMHTFRCLHALPCASMHLYVPPCTHTRTWMLLCSQVLDTWVDHSYPGSIMTTTAYTKVRQPRRGV